MIRLKHLYTVFAFILTLILYSCLYSALYSPLVMAQDFAFHPALNGADRDIPQPAGSRFGPGKEGWAILRYSVLADGSITNIDIIDEMPPRLIAKDIEKAMADWSYVPARDNGESIDLHNIIETFTFDNNEMPNISGPAVMALYQEPEELMAEERFERALRRSVRHLRQSAFTLHDIGLFNTQIATIGIRLPDMHVAYQAIKRATHTEVEQLTRGELAVALQYRFIIETNLGRYLDALDTYQRLNSMEDFPVVDSIQEQARTIEAALGDTFTLTLKAKIAEDEAQWFHIPGSRAFSISDVEGELTALDIACQRNVATLEYQQDVEWSLPDSWGDCSILVKGDESTTFTFIEYH